jgi:anti-sigma-K factor RskA
MIRIYGMTNQDHVSDLLPAYALGALDHSEVERVKSHLSMCPACRQELREFETITGDLALAVTEMSPRPKLRQELMSRIGKTQPAAVTARKPTYWQQLTGMFRQNRAIAFSQIALLALVLILATSTLLLWGQVNNQHLDRESGHLQAVRLQSTGVIPGAEGYITVSGDGLSGAIVLDRVPQLTEDQRYQLWLVKGDQRLSAALLAVDELGYGGGRIQAPESLFNYATAEVTIEPHDGSPQPTTDVILSAPLFP